MEVICQRERWNVFVEGNIYGLTLHPSVAHPQSNGQAETANQELLRGIKPQLRVPLIRMSGCWFEELPSVLWSIRTTPNRSTGLTPFSLFMEQRRSLK